MPAAGFGAMTLGSQLRKVIGSMQAMMLSMPTPSSSSSCDSDASAVDVTGAEVGP